MSERRWAGSWLGSASGSGEKTAGAYPGQRLGFPETGPGAVAGAGRRLGAIFIDWLLCELIAIALLHNQYWTIAVFGVEVWLLTALTGFTVGKRLTRIRVIRLDGRPVGLWWSLVRTVLLLAVIPPLVYDRDQRGLHDKAANTAVVRI